MAERTFSLLQQERGTRDDEVRQQIGQGDQDGVVPRASAGADGTGQEGGHDDPAASSGSFGHGALPVGNTDLKSTRLGGDVQGSVGGRLK